MELKPDLVRTFVRERQIPVLHKTQKTFESLSITEKVIFLLAALVFAVVVFSLVHKISLEYTVEVPLRGGTLSEGVIGTPRFVNPLLAVSDTDRDLTTLVYSGLLKATAHGNFVPDLAESYSVSSNGLVYDVKIRQDVYFTDATPVTADDVVYTVTKAQDITLKSPRRVNWDGVTVEKKDAHEVVFTLKQPYAPFISNLTLGILPAHLWKNLASDQIPFSDKNINPIGSGPYLVGQMSRSGDGIPTSLSLRANPDYALGKPYIETIDFTFLANEKDLVSELKNGSIQSAPGITPASAIELGTKYRTLRTPLSRVFAVFFNQNQNEILAHKEVRKALDKAIDKDALIGSVLLGYGTKTDGPLPPTAFGAQATAPSVTATGTSTSTMATSTPTTDAQALLTKAGWKKNADGIFEFKAKGKTAAATSTLSLSLSTANVPDLVESAKRIEDDWKALGAEVDVRVFEPGDLNQGVIRPRKYDALLFGIVIGKNSDLYPFWHSSQRNDPGLNISLYTNATADKLLEKMRQSTSTALLAKQYADLKTELNTDTPAIFLWSPDFIYVVPDNLRGIDMGEITTPSDRFLGVEKWYIETDNVWSIFTKDKALKN